MFSPREPCEPPVGRWHRKARSGRPVVKEARDQLAEERTIAAHPSQRGKNAAPLEVISTPPSWPGRSWPGISHALPFSLAFHLLAEGESPSTQGESIMKTPSMLGLALAALLPAVLLAEDGPKKEPKPDSGALAKKLITQCARVKDGDIVRISGGVRDVELLENLTVEAAKRGADTLLILAPRDRTLRRLYTEVPTKFDSRLSPTALKLAETVTVIIGVDPTDDDAILADVPAERINARMNAGMKVMETLLKRNVRQVYLGNGLYPTETRAKQYGLSQAELAKQFYGGLNVDYDTMQATGEAIRKALAAAKKVHITTPDGTDLTVDIAKRSAFVSDGVLSEEKISKGGPACQVWLPAGEVYLTPVPGTAEGKVVVERMLWEGKEVRGLTLTFNKGKLKSMKAKSGLERLQALYDAASAGKDAFSFLDIGINPAVQLPKKSPAGLFMEAGTITVGTGNNVWAGGDNKSSFGIATFLRGGTLLIDDKPLVKDGSLQIAAGGRADEDETAKELKRLEGVWASTPAKKGRDRGHVLVFQGGKMGWSSFQTRDGEPVIGHSKLYDLRVDPKAAPKQITATRGKGEDGEKRLGIYELDGDTLKVAFGSEGKRPKKFGDGESQAIVLTRNKAAKVPDLTKPSETEIKPTASWLGQIGDAKLEKQCPERPVTTKAEFEKLWKALRGAEKLPKVDFAKEFVLVRTSTRAEMTAIGLYVVEGKEEASESVSVVIGQKKIEGFTYAIGVFRRELVDVVDGRIIAKGRKKK
jgi:uncharacterized protein (TIGR03067 family)